MLTTVRRGNTQKADKAQVGSRGSGYSIGMASYCDLKIRTEALETVYLSRACLWTQLILVSLKSPSTALILLTKATKLVKGLEHKSYGEAAEGPGVV